MTFAPNNFGTKAQKTSKSGREWIWIALYLYLKYRPLSKAVDRNRNIKYLKKYATYPPLLLNLIGMR
jgi:hypothetical protein